MEERYLVHPSENYATQWCNGWAEAKECAQDYANEIGSTVYVFAEDKEAWEGYGNDPVGVFEPLAMEME